MIIWQFEKRVSRCDFVRAKRESAFKSIMRRKSQVFAIHSRNASLTFLYAHLTSNIQAALDFIAPSICPFSLGQHSAWRGAFVRGVSEKIRMQAYRVSVHAIQSRTHSGPPWALWRKEFCLAACLAERHVQGWKQGTTAKHGTRVIAGTVVFCRRHLRSAFGAKRTLSARQDRLNWSKMTIAVLRADPNSQNIPAIFECDPVSI
jgi:hypothetical protein